MDKCNCSFNWVELDKFNNSCTYHNNTFDIGSVCPFYKKPEFKTPTLIADAHAKPKSENSKKVHEQSRTITNKSRKVIVERFHCYRIKFIADVQWDHLFKYEEFSLNNNVKFKRIDFDEAIVKVFRKSILITLRANQDIKGLPVKEAKNKADLIIDSVLNKLPKAIQIKEGQVASIHNAFVNHPFAKYDLNVKVNGETRLITDHSKGKLEFEAVNTEFAFSDSEKIENDNISLIDKGLSREFLAQAINYLIEDRKFWAEHQRSHVEAIQTLSSTVKELKDQVIQSQLTHHKLEANSHTKPLLVINSLPPTISKYDVERKEKIKKFIEVFK